MTIALKTLIRQFSTVACSRRIGGFTSSQRIIGVLLINCSRSGMFYCVLWYVSLYVVVCGMSSEKPYMWDKFGITAFARYSSTE